MYIPLLTRLHFNSIFLLFQKTIYGANVVIFEGILAFAKKDMLPVSLAELLFTGIFYSIPHTC